MRKIQSAVLATVVGAGVLFSPAVRAQNLEQASASDQVKDDLFAGTEKFATGASDVSEVNMDQKTLGMMTGSSKNAALAKKMDFVVVRSYTYDKPAMYRMSDLAVFRQRLTDGSWSCIVHEQTRTESTDVCVRTGADHESNEMVVISAEPKELSFVHLKGRMSLADLQGLKGQMGGAPAPTPPVPPLTPRN